MLIWDTHPFELGLGKVHFIKKGCLTRNYYMVSNYRMNFSVKRNRILVTFFCKLKNWIICYVEIDHTMATWYLHAVLVRLSGNFGLGSKRSFILVM